MGRVGEGVRTDRGSRWLGWEDGQGSRLDGLVRTDRESCW